jgi:hypothetical protein
MEVLGEVKAAYGSDPDIAGIVSAGEAICDSLGEPAASFPAATPESSLSPEIIIETTPPASPEAMLEATELPSP